MSGSSIGGKHNLEVTQYLFVAALGLMVGSFLNVVIYRLPRGESVVRPRSRCPSCRAKIRWFQNIPVLSYLALRGRCASCGARILLIYPVVELLTAFAFLIAVQRFGVEPIVFIRDIPFLCLLIAITFIDLEHRIIPDALSLGGLAWGLVTSWAAPGFSALDSIMGAGLGFGFFFGFAWLYERITGRSGLGGGDVKFIAMLGAFLGPGGVLFTMLASSVIGSVVGIAVGLASREANLMRTSIPYGPFLALGALIYAFIGEELWRLFTIPI